ncbi:MAG: hypothetical protein E7616_06820 [Ruminococcaceae bacterium]|nr:hypothetical protein [Oscillospiraceae bacterium]
MNKDFIIKDVNDYLAGKITRSELSFRVKNRRTATPFLLDHYCSYANLLLDGVEQKLMAIPEQSYCDDDLKRIIAVLEGRQSVQYHFVYVIPNQMIDSDLQKLMQITESFLYNLEQGKTHRIKVGVRLTNGEDIYNNTDAFFTQEEYDFCQSMHDILSNDTQDTVVKSVARNLLSIINRYVGGWESITTYFASTQTIPGDILSKDLKRSLQALCGKRPIYVTLHGRIDNLNATIVL